MGIRYSGVKQFIVRLLPLAAALRAANVGQLRCE